MPEVYLFQEKSNFIDALSGYQALTENEKGNRMDRIKMDRAGEKTSSAVEKFANSGGSMIEYSPQYASKSNGSAERLIQDLWKISRTILSNSGLPHNLWNEVI